jgi:hypothetical protein
MVTTMLTGGILLSSIALKNLFSSRGFDLGAALRRITALRRPVETASKP